MCVMGLMETCFPHVSMRQRAIVINRAQHGLDAELFKIRDATPPELLGLSVPDRMAALLQRHKGLRRDMAAHALSVSRRRAVCQDMAMRWFDLMTKKKMGMDVGRDDAPHGSAVFRDDRTEVDASGARVIERRAIPQVRSGNQTQLARTHHVGIGAVAQMQRHGVAGMVESTNDRPGTLLFGGR